MLLNESEDNSHILLSSLSHLRWYFTAWLSIGQFYCLLIYHVRIIYYQLTRLQCRPTVNYIYIPCKIKLSRAGFSGNAKKMEHYEVRRPFSEGFLEESTIFRRLPTTFSNISSSINFECHFSLKIGTTTASYTALVKLLLGQIFTFFKVFII